MLPDSMLQSLIDRLIHAVWNRPELAPLRQPIEAALQTRGFHQLAREALTTFAEDADLDEDFITQAAVQDALMAYVVGEHPARFEKLLGHIRRDTLDQLRQTFAAHPIYGPILTAGDLRTAVLKLYDLQSDVTAVRALLDKPAIKAVMQRWQGAHVFLSYSRHDALQVQPLREALEAAEHTVWQDISAIKGGEEWLRAIDEGIKRAYAVVVVLSDASWKSYWVREEFAHARRYEKLVVPFRLDDIDIPLGMHQLNVIDAAADFETGVGRLLQSIKRRPSHEERLLAEPDRYALEDDYRRAILLKHGAWTNIYTPLAGTMPSSAWQQPEDAPRMAQIRGLAEVQQLITAWTRNTFNQMVTVKPIAYDDIMTAAIEMKRMVIVGQPGAGKSTTLWRLAADYCSRSDDMGRPLVPVLVPLGAASPGVGLADLIRRELGALERDELQRERRLVYLLDGLNEIPVDCRAMMVADIRDLIAQCYQNDQTVIITCRELDYSGVLDVGLEGVRIEPLDPLRIQQFIDSYITDPPGAAAELFWELVGDQACAYWAWFQDEIGDDPALFWLAEELPDGIWRRLWDEWLEVRHQSPGLLGLIQNPMMLYITMVVTTEHGAVPDNRARLFELYVDYMLQQQLGLDQAAAHAIQDSLSHLAFDIKRGGHSFDIELETATDYMGDAVALFQARTVGLLKGSETLRFGHQLLLEYFAARYLVQHLHEVAASDFWPPANWWQEHEWDEVAIFVGGLLDDDMTPLVEWLGQANPELMARCVVESGTPTPLARLETIAARLAPRLVDVEQHPHPAERAALGRALGRLELDWRPGVGVRDDGLPDIEWMQVPAGPFRYQATDLIDLPTYYIARYPVTYIQYQAFLADGYDDQRWWEGLADRTDVILAQAFPYANHPRDSVTWYQALAFCRWLSYRLGGPFGLEAVMDWPVRLPLETEWEKAARGTSRKNFPWEEDRYISGYANVNEAEMMVGTYNLKRSTPVGMYPQSASPYGVEDLCGNVSEWCLDPFAGGRDLALSSGVTRVLRGGVWYRYPARANLKRRTERSPDSASLGRGFRVCTSHPVR